MLYWHQIAKQICDCMYFLPYWVYILIAVAVILTFYGLSKLMEERHQILSYTLSILLSIPFFIIWLVCIEALPFLNLWIILLYLWCFITLIEVTRRNLRKQWCRNIISCIVEVPLLFIVFWNIFLIWENTPNLFEWVNAEDTFWSMIWHCALIIAGYVVITWVWNKFVITWLMPGGSKWSLMLFEAEFFLAVYWTSLDVIDGLYGFNYCLGIIILFFGALFMWGISVATLGSERCPRCHRVGSDYMGDADGGYENSVSYQWYTKSSSSEKEVKQLDRIEETRHVTIYYHKCPYCETEWQTSSSRLVNREITPVKQRITTWENRW